MSRERVAITGWGVVSAGGAGRRAFADFMVSGRSALGEVFSFDVEGLGSERAAEIEEFDVEPLLRSPKNFLDRNSQLAFGACEMAVRDAGMALPAQEGEHPGLAFGSGAANLATLAMFHRALVEKGPRLAPPFVFPHTYPNTTASLLSIEYGLSGPHMVFAGAGSAGAEALACGLRLIREGRARAVLAGGAEAFSEALYRGARAAGWLSPTDGGEEGCRPFAATRNGTILGEGAAMFALESSGRAQAEPCGLLAGAGQSSSAADAMFLALADAGVAAAEVDMVVAAAGGYVERDAEEAAALARVFSGLDTLVTAPKAALGETLGASGPLGLAAALAAIERGVAPGCGEEAADLPKGLNVVASPRKADVNVALVNAAHPDRGAWVSLLVTQVGAV